VGKVLDLGCGNGSLCKLLKDSYPALEVVGADRDERGINLAAAAYSNVRFFKAGVEDDPLTVLSSGEDRYDLVISTEVVEHLYAPRLLPQFASEILKPQGQLVISTPYHGYLKNLALSLLNKWDSHHTALWEGGHIKFWSRRTLTDLLERNGYCVTRFMGIGRAPFLWKSMIIVANKL
jgi:2-polyprenyl-3-methyl-5-hydroxy-6-metoxy-1,4-benzoquinol methylase